MPIPQRPRVDKYLVLKWEDVHNLLNSRQVSSLIESYNIIHQHRVRSGTTRQYVTVSNKDLPLFDEVWGMVLSDIQTSREDEMERIRGRMSNLEQTLFRGLNPTSSTQDEMSTENEAPEGPEEDVLINSYDFQGTHTHRISSIGTGRNTTLRDIENSFNTAWTLSSASGSVDVSPTSVTVSRADGTPVVRMGSTDSIASATAPEGFVEANGQEVHASGFEVRRSDFPNPWADLVRGVRENQSIAWQVDSDSDQIAFDLETRDSGEINDNLRFGMAD